VTARPAGGRAALADPGDGSQHGEPDFVQSLQRGLAVIRAFDADNPALSLSEVARATGLARAAARRFLLTLVELGYMRADGRLFRLSPRVLELGRPYLASLTLPEIALPHLRDLVADVRESATAAVLDGDDIVYVAHAPAKRIMSISITIGARDPGFATSLGRVLLAAQSDDWLDEYLARVELAPITARTLSDPARLRAELIRIRRQGFALVDQELEEGLRALAVPIRDHAGDVISAINLAVHTSRWSVDAIRHELLPRLLAAAAAIQTDLGTDAVSGCRRPGEAPGSAALAAASCGPRA
jgi:IclR family pca regulon transcriptional regulator